MALTSDELVQLRADEEALLPDQCTITRAGDGSPGTFNETTGRYDGGPAADEIYEGACRIAPLSASDRSLLFGDKDINVLGYRITLPHDAPVLSKDDAVEVTASADPQLVGRHLEVHSFEVKSLQTKRRVILQEVRSA